jgi:hypothetical protein
MVSVIELYRARVHSGEIEFFSTPNWFSENLNYMETVAITLNKKHLEMEDVFLIRDFFTRYFPKIPELSPGYFTTLMDSVWSFENRTSFLDEIRNSIIPLFVNLEHNYYLDCFSYLQLLSIKDAINKRSKSPFAKLL